MRTVFLVPMVLVCLAGRAQDNRLFKPFTPDSLHTSLPADGIRPGAVTVHESAKITALMTDYASHEHPLSGYRIQIFIGDRNTAENMRRTFLLKHPDVPAYLSYLAPNFRVRVGDLRDRVTAEKLREEFNSEFPGSYVVPDAIELPRLAKP
jgi:hypothetical protein